MPRRLLILAIAITSVTLTACSTPTAPVEKDDCGGVYGGSSTRCDEDGGN